MLPGIFLATLIAVRKWRNARTELDGAAVSLSLHSLSSCSLWRRVWLYVLPIVSKWMGERLAANLMAYADRPEVIVLALPRGGVPIGFIVARTLHVPLDIFPVRKLGVPGHEELAMGQLPLVAYASSTRMSCRHLRFPTPSLIRSLLTSSARSHAAAWVMLS
jgi:hypothetical protein